MRSFRIGLGIALGLVGVVAVGQEWRTLNTEHFTVFYPAGYEAAAWDALETLEHYRPFVEGLVGNTAYHLPVVIEDLGTVTNGFTNPVFYNVHLFPYSPAGGELGFTENWWRLVGVHEYTHLLHLTKRDGIPGLLTAVGGTLFLPQLWLPGWMLEGITVYAESQLSPYEGRLSDGYFDAYMAIRAKEGFPTPLEAAYSPFGFPGGAGIYLYGGEFFNYLAQEYGEEKFSEFFERFGSSPFSYYSPLIPALGLDRVAREVFGKPFPELWRDWQAHLEETTEFTSVGERLTELGWTVASPVIAAGRLYYLRSYSEKTGALSSWGFQEIMERDLATGEERVIGATTSYFAGPLRVHAGKLYYGVGELKPGYPNAVNLGFGFTTELHELDPVSGADRALFSRDLRAFAVLPDGRVIYSVDRRDAFGSELWAWDPATKEHILLATTDYLVGELLAYGDGLVASARRDWENFGLYTLNPEAWTLAPLLDSPYWEGAIGIGGDKLLFTANYEKVYRVYACDLATGEVYRLTQGGFARDGALDEEQDNLYFVGLGRDGFDLWRAQPLWEPFQVPREALPGRPDDLTLSPAAVAEGDFWDDLLTLAPKIHVPIFSYLPEGATAGLFLLGQDALGYFLYSALGAWDFGQGTPGLSLLLTSTFPSPLTTGLELAFGLGQEPRLSLSAGYPLISWLSPGLGGLSFGLSATAHSEGFSRRGFSPALSAAWQYPDLKLSWQGAVNLERVALGSSLDRTGLSTAIALVRHLPQSQVSLKVQGIYDPDNPDPVFPILRGYEEPLLAKAGVKLSLDYSWLLGEIRRGLWNPNVYLEDLTANFFIDIALAEATQFACGVELYVETGIMFVLKLAPGVRLSFNQDHEFSVSFAIAGL